MEHKPIIITREELGDAEVTVATLKNAVFNFLHSDAYEDILEIIVEINEKYGNSWQQDGAFISLGDIKDKLTRMEYILENEGFTERQAVMDNAGNVVFDLFVRSLLLMIWQTHIKEYIKERYDISI